MLIGILSDTHGYLDPRLLRHFADCDEIWHAGDWGAGVSDQLLAASARRVRGVFGNIDDESVRDRYPENQRFECGGLRVLLTHIAGSPGRLNPRVREELAREPADLLVSGHSHAVWAYRDRSRGLLMLNPGAAGREGAHPVRTAMRLELAEGEVTRLQLIELGSRG